MAFHCSRLAVYRSRGCLDTRCGILYMCFGQYRFWLEQSREGRAGRERPALAGDLQEFKVNFDRGPYRDRETVFLSRAELPLADCFHSLLIESQAEAFDDVDVLGYAIDVDDHTE